MTKPPPTNPHGMMYDQNPRMKELVDHSNKLVLPNKTCYSVPCDIPSLQLHPPTHISLPFQLCNYSLHHSLFHLPKPFPLFLPPIFFGSFPLFNLLVPFSHHSFNVYITLSTPILRCLHLHLVNLFIFLICSYPLSQYGSSAFKNRGYIPSAIVIPSINTNTTDAIIKNMAQGGNSASSGGLGDRLHFTEKNSCLCREMR